MTLDTDFVRSQFPAFSVPSLRDQAFFENAGGSYSCQQVIDRLTRYYRERKVQPYGPYEASRLAGEEMDEARARLAAMLGVENRLLCCPIHQSFPKNPENNFWKKSLKLLTELNKLFSFLLPYQKFDEIYFYSKKMMNDLLNSNSTKD